MTQFTKMWNGLLLPRSCANSPPVPPLPYSSQEWDSTSGIAATLGSIALSRRLTLEEKKKGAAIVHYGVGSAAGVSYAILVHHRSVITHHSGAFFGLGLWLIADELLMPSLGLSRELGCYSFQAQANSLGEHLVYAVTTDLVYRYLSAQ